MEQWIKDAGQKKADQHPFGEDLSNIKVIVDEVIDGKTISHELYYVQRTAASPLLSKNNNPGPRKWEHHPKDLVEPRTGRLPVE